MDVSDYIKNNLNAYLDNTYELSIIDGFGNEPTGGTSVGAIRESYRHWLCGVREGEVDPVHATAGAAS